MQYVIKSNNPYESEVARMIEKVRKQQVQLIKVPVIDRSKWEPCVLCESKALKEVGIGDYYGYRVFLRGGIGEVDENERFQFCPKCGRPLTEQAWKELERRVCVE